MNVKSVQAPASFGYLFCRQWNWIEEKDEQKIFDLFFGLHDKVDMKEVVLAYLFAKELRGITEERSLQLLCRVRV